MLTGLSEDDYVLHLRIRELEDLLITAKWLIDGLVSKKCECHEQPLIKEKEIEYIRKVIQTIEDTL